MAPLTLYGVGPGTSLDRRPTTVLGVTWDRSACVFRPAKWSSQIRRDGRRRPPPSRCWRR